SVSSTTLRRPATTTPTQRYSRATTACARATTSKSATSSWSRTRIATRTSRNATASSTSTTRFSSCRGASACAATTASRTSRPATATSYSRSCTCTSRTSGLPAEVHVDSDRDAATSGLTRVTKAGAGREVGAEHPQILFRTLVQQVVEVQGQVDVAAAGVESIAESCVDDVLGGDLVVRHVPSRAGAVEVPVRVGQLVLGPAPG